MLEFGSLSIDLEGIEEVLLTKWKQIRVNIVAPLLRVAVLICLIMTLMIFVEKVFVGLICLVVKVFKLKPEKRYRWEPMRPETSDLEIGVLSYPMVLVQIPMYNEKEVYKLSIRAVCNLDWPSDRMIIQVLDDSTDPVVKDLVGLECKIWKNRGLNINHEVRNNRNGYKAGALKDGMLHYSVKDCEYVAIFDADFQPESDFLKRTVPFLIHNPEIALVQARWKFVNANECMMTRMQEMSLDYHFKIEQEAGSSAFSFFGFNGTAGVWRISTIADAGGWKDRTTVEDMDLAVRSSLDGWKFVYVGDVKVKCELPSTFKAYRYQQHRWSCGPANLFKKMILEIIANKKVSTWKKIHLIYNFFFIGKIVAHTSAYIFSCIVIPLSVLIPEVEIPLWGVAYIPTIITLLKSVGTPSSFHLVIPWVLFENVMSLHRIKAATTGFLDVGRVNEWIVTTKLGDGSKTKPSMEVIVKNAKDLRDAKVIEPLLGDYKKPQVRTRQRFHLAELWMGVFMFSAGFYDVAYTKKGYFIYLFMQSCAFLIIGFDFIGTYVKTS
ncbi:probable glucomannan 4-beta-mannosyltransferase 11 [Dendrobium catenatum]|uniref:glucomannan 4-beta-mannosyltransferase n=1 Tax=Dendrobium catenatum TaxID=906689 RepID=A0A2I0VUA7_9ASPA|nr:probable glucomannan 4-beta-mannosyltransferase 11 [Dendrobium catenatum]PKU66991.1 putative mannan synthase 11 [Dendrobium catenatum]